MRIGMILENDFPPDIRVEKEARSLIEAGHKVYLLCMQKKTGPSEEVVDNIFVRRIQGFKNFFLKKI